MIASLVMNHAESSTTVTPSEPGHESGHELGHESGLVPGVVRGAAGARLAWVAFPLALWAVSFLYFGGDIGWYADDLAMVMRDARTGAIDWSWTPWQDYPYFWRPIQLIVCYYGITLSYEHNWIAHAVTASLHAWAAWSLFRLGRTAGIGRESAAAGSLAFMVWPLTYEVALWPAAASTAIASGLATTLARVALTTSLLPRIAWWRWILLAMLAFLIACANEQPACVVAALPMLILAAPASGRSWRERVFRGLLIPFVCGVALLVYLGLMFGTAPASGTRSSAGSLIRLGDVPARFAYVVDAITATVERRIPDFLIGGFQTGWAAMNSVAGVAAIAMCGAAAAWWARAWIAGRSATSTGSDSASETTIGSSSTARCSRAWLVAFAVAWFAAAWVPIMLLKGQIAEVRLMYPMWTAIAFGAAAALDPLLAWWRDRGGTLACVTRAAGAAAAGLGLIASSVCLVGAQRAIRSQTEADARQARDLKAAAPDVPERTVFTLLRTDYWPARTGRDLFDRTFFAVSWAQWSAPRLIKREFRRIGISATRLNPWDPFPLSDISDTGFVYKEKITEIKERTERGTPISWDQSVPYVINAQGGAELVHTIFVERADGRDLTVYPKLMRGKAGHRVAIPFEGAPAAAEGGSGVEGWVGADGVSVPSFDAVSMWGVSRAATLLRPTGTDAVRGGMSAAIAADARASRVTLRATFNPLELDGRALMDQVGVRWTLEAIGSSPSAGSTTSAPGGAEVIASGRVGLSPSVIRNDRRWVAVSVEVPASTEALRLRIEIEGTGESPSVWMTRGWRVFE